MKVTADLFDPEALSEIASQKLAELEETKLPEEKAETVRWIMDSNSVGSYLWLLSLLWLTNFDERKKKLQKEKAKWLRYLTVKGQELSNLNLPTIREYPIEDLLDTPVRQFSGKWVSLCPFHEEKTGSFTIYPNNSYHCFGCGVHGHNAIDFVMAKYELGFMEAVAKLSNLGGGQQ